MGSTAGSFAGECSSERDALLLLLSRLFALVDGGQFTDAKVATAMEAELKRHVSDRAISPSSPRQVAEVEGILIAVDAKLKCTLDRELGDMRAAVREAVQKLAVGVESSLLQQLQRISVVESRLKQLQGQGASCSDDLDCSVTSTRLSTRSALSSISGLSAVPEVEEREDKGFDVEGGP